MKKEKEKEKEKDENKSWRQIYGMLVAYKKYFPGIFLCLSGASCMTFLQPLIIRRITDQGMVEKNMKCILVFSGALVGVALIHRVLGLIQASLFSNIHNSLTRSLYERSYWKLNRLRIHYFDDKGSAEITNTICADINNVASVADQITTFSISSILQIMGGIVGLSLLDWKLAFLIVLVIPVKFAIIHYFAKKKNLVFERWIENNRVFFGWLGDCINGIREMKLWNLFDIRDKEFENLQRKMMNSYKENSMLDEYRTSSVSFLDTVLNAALYILSGLFIIKGEFTIGGAFAFITYSGYVVSPISFLINIKYYFAQIKPSAKRLFEFWEQEEEVDLSAGSITKANYNTPDEYVPALELDGIFFRYGEGTSVLNGASLCVERKERVAIIGENGSGKSTLLNLLSGFYQPQYGTIRLFGVSTEILGVKQLRNKIAVISQKPYLFQGTIEENVNIDGRASHNEVVSACEKSGALVFIEELEHGFDQKIGQDGGKLSGGEKQKIAVARALLKKADILLMDEATAGLDMESDKALNELLCNELKNTTIIFITHRYEDLLGVQKVYRLSEGILKAI